MAEHLVDHNSFACSRPFYDDKNYPRGISRSGDYSMKEVTILEKYGCTLLALSDGSQPPNTDEEVAFVNVVQGQQEAQTLVEKTWLKYLQKTRQPKHFHTLFGRSKIDASDSDIPADDVETDNNDL